MAVGTSNEDDRQETYGSSGTDTTARAGTESGDVEQYGVWVKAGPVDIVDDEEPQSQFKMEDLEPESADGTLTQEEEELLGSLESEETEPPNAVQEDFDVGSLPDFEDSAGEEPTIENLDLSPEDQSAEDIEDHNLDREESEALDDIGGFELDLPDSNEEEESMDIPEESAPILQKIEKDLLSIKEELTALKNEVYSLRSGGPQIESEEQRDETESGFFEEDEDETIALTGDELDNILNTADITEQTGQSTASPEESDLLLEEEVPQAESIIDREDILLDEEETPAEAPEIDLGTEDLASEDLSLDESLADIASVTEPPTEELTLDEEPALEEVPEIDEDVLDLPEEEEIVLDDISGTEDLNLAEVTAESPLPQTEAPEAVADETTFELDEELELSPSEQEDLEASQELLGEEELADLPEPELDEAELAQMESEAEEAAPADVSSAADQTLDEAFDLTDEELEMPEIESLEEAEAPAEQPSAGANGDLPEDLKSEIRAILKYMDQLLESLPEEKIEEFANSEYFNVYKKLFEELGLTT